MLNYCDFALDMAARKEAMMNAVRQEMALQNAQELMNVRSALTYMEHTVQLEIYLESQRKLLCQVRYKAWRFSVKHGAGKGLLLMPTFMVILLFVLDLSVKVPRPILGCVYVFSRELPLV